MKTVFFFLLILTYQLHAQEVTPTERIHQTLEFADDMKDNDIMTISFGGNKTFFAHHSL